MRKIAKIFENFQSLTKNLVKLWRKWRCECSPNVARMWLKCGPLLTSYNI